MWALLEYPNYWMGATAILHAENIPDAFWKRRNDLLLISVQKYPDCRGKQRPKRTTPRC
jgi:hypothetical protein